MKRFTLAITLSLAACATTQKGERIVAERSKTYKLPDGNIELKFTHREGVNRRERQPHLDSGLLDTDNNMSQEKMTISGHTFRIVRTEYRGVVTTESEELVNEFTFTPIFEGQKVEEHDPVVVSKAHGRLVNMFSDYFLRQSEAMIQGDVTYNCVEDNDFDPLPYGPGLAIISARNGYVLTLEAYRNYRILKDRVRTVKCMDSTDSAKEIAEAKKASDAIFLRFRVKDPYEPQIEMATPVVNVKPHKRGNL